jgi:hypothetical protein
MIESTIEFPSALRRSRITFALTGLCVAGIASAHIYACYREEQNQHVASVIAAMPAHDASHQMPNDAITLAVAAPASRAADASILVGVSASEQP